MCQSCSPQSGVPISKNRRKLWELEGLYHCPVIGTCIGADELRKLAQKSGQISTHGKGDYWLHSWYVGNAREKNLLSMQVQKVLEKKYQAALRRFAQARTPEQLQQMWQQSVARGAVAEALWATLTHGQCSEALATEVYETVHMLSHQVGAGQRADLARWRQVEQELEDAKAEHIKRQRKAKATLLTKEERIRELEAQLAAQQTANLELAQENEQLSQAEPAGQCQESPARLLQRVEHLEGVLSEAQQQRDHWQLTAQTAKRALAKVERQALLDARTLEAIASRSLSPCDSCGSDSCLECPDLKGQKVLCVGGHPKLIEQFSQLVTRCNGEFSHHDGGREDNQKRLDAMLWAADTVICAADHVSHNAYYRLKKFCKQHQKRHFYLSNASLTAFARTLGQAARDDVELVG